VEEKKHKTLVKQVSGRGRGRKPSTDWVLVGFDEDGVEIARIVNLTEEEANLRANDYPRAVTMKDEKLGAGTLCGVKDCGSLAITRVRPASLEEAIPVCRYHASGVYLKFKGLPVEKKLRLKSIDRVVAPDWLCFNYCPSFYKGECRAMTDVMERELKKNLAKGFRGMSILCIEDHWWRL